MCLQRSSPKTAKFIYLQIEKKSLFELFENLSNSSKTNSFAKRSTLKEMNETVPQSPLTTQEENDLIKRFSQRVVKERMGNFHKLKRSINGEVIYPEVDCNANSNWGAKLLQKSELIQRNKLVNVETLKEDVVYYNGSEHNLLYRKRMKFPKLNSNDVTLKINDSTNTRSNTGNDNTANADGDDDFDLNKLVSVKDILTPISSLSDVVNKPSISRTFSNTILDKLSLRTILMIEKEQDSVIRYSKLLDTFLGDYPKPLYEANLKLPDYDHNLILPDDDDDEDDENGNNYSNGNDTDDDDNDENDNTKNFTSSSDSPNSAKENYKDSQDTIIENAKLGNITNLENQTNKDNNINLDSVKHNNISKDTNSKNNSNNKDDEENITMEDVNTTIEEDNKNDATKLINQNILSNGTAIDDQTKLNSDDTATTTIIETTTNTNSNNSDNNVNATLQDIKQNEQIASRADSNDTVKIANMTNKITNNNNDTITTAEVNKNDNNVLNSISENNIDVNISKNSDNDIIDSQQTVTKNDPFFALPAINGKDGFHELVDNINDMETIEQMEITRQMAQIALQRNEEYIRNLQKIRNFFDNAERIRERIYSWGQESAGIQDEDVTVPNVLRVVKRGLISATTNRTMTGIPDNEEYEENQ